ncbi:MAG: glycosyltransferase [Cyanosarcina radialis HA8281-LM2]|jgi:glycosyltransferase involved in cell wall biosynthesis|nr:glycosyltransferase [Cyanosarcina radialis HA8281-LM2]
MLSENPLVSVVIPTFNRADLIDISLSSAMGQSYRNIEIIVVDDGSTDRTEDAVRAIGDPRIVYARHSTNQGGAAARNTGIETAKGEYIAFLDSDDAWMPNKIEVQLDLIQRQPHPERVVCYTQVFYSNSGISPETYQAFDERFFLPKRGKEETESVSDFLFCQRGYMVTSTLMLHRSLALATRFQEKFRKHQDWDFCLRLEANGANFYFIQSPLSIWNGDSRYEHVGRMGDYRVSESWFDECKPYFSSRAATAFLLNKVLPSLIKEKKRKLFVQKSIVNALLQRLINFNKFINLSAQIWSFD